MKYLYITLLLFASTGLSAQQANAVSAYIDVEVESENFSYYGLQYKNNFSGHHSVQTNLGLGSKSNFEIGLDYLYDVPIVGQRLFFILGGGVGIDFHSNKSSLGKKSFYLFRPQVGFDFFIPKTPLSLFAVYKPKFDLKEFDTFDMSSIQSGIRFHF